MFQQLLLPFADLVRMQLELCAQFSHGAVLPQSSQRHLRLAIEAAVDGMGVVMGPMSMIRNEIESGTLAPLFPKKILQTPGYYSICNRADASDPKVVQFRLWLESEGITRGDRAHSHPSGVGSAAAAASSRAAG